MTTFNKKKDIDGKFALFESSREPAVGVSRCGSAGQSDSRVGSVNAAASVMEPGCPRYGLGLARVRE